MSPEELQQLNNLRDENIFEGDVLAVSAGTSAGHILLYYCSANVFFTKLS